MLRIGSVQESAGATIGGSMDQGGSEIEAWRSERTAATGAGSTNAPVDSSSTPTDRGATKDLQTDADDADRRSQAAATGSALRGQEPAARTKRLAGTCGYAGATQRPCLPAGCECGHVWHGHARTGRTAPTMCCQPHSDGLSVAHGLARADRDAANSLPSATNSLLVPTASSAHGLTWRAAVGVRIADCSQSTARSNGRLSFASRCRAVLATQGRHSSQRSSHATRGAGDQVSSL